MSFYRIAVSTVIFSAFSLSAARAETVTVCTVVADASTGELLKQEGACDTRTTSASTFKIAISLMGFDSGFLKDAHTPALPFVKGYPDWNPAWRATIDPASWMKESVFWYSQQVTKSLGEKRFKQYVHAFGYGNMDTSGDPGKKNGLTKSWIGSSLEISPLEQIKFLRKVVRQELPLSSNAYEMTKAIIDIGPQPNGWHVYGRTGTGASRNLDGTKAREKPWGWFVGWATKDDRTIVFARLTKDSTRPSNPPGPAARKAVLNDLFSGSSDF